MPDHGEHLTVHVDRDLCMGSGMCVMYAPGTFDQDDQTKAVVTDPRGDTAEQVRIAVEACPTGALSLADNDKGA
ncbi:MAG TPA: (4Fe-4S)-binding protein [Acidimicrobiales bacterium]|nr:(4Fe-4S)-binding protein [Acidimicrobiales bacterium]